MAESRKTKYQKAIERAQSRGYASPYAERKARAQAQGYSSPRTLRDARASKPRDNRAEYAQAKRLAAAQGFRNPKERRVAKTLGLQGAELETWQRTRTLAYFGISLSRFNEIRRENKAYAYEGTAWTKLNTYDLARDREVHNWSEYRVGYIISFHSAIVNPRTNWDSLPKSIGADGKVIRAVDRYGNRITNSSQFYYLVKYSELMQIDEFEARYGRSAIIDAQTGRVQP